MDTWHSLALLCIFHLPWTEGTSGLNWHTAIYDWMHKMHNIGNFRTCLGLDEVSKLKYQLIRALYIFCKMWPGTILYFKLSNKPHQLGDESVLADFPVKLAIIYSLVNVFNTIPLNILRFRAKTMPQIEGKRQGSAKLAPTRGE